MKHIITNSLLKSSDLHRQLLEDTALIDTLAKVAEKAVDILRNGGKIMLCGNGGSASDAQHIAAELTGRYYKDRPALDAVALNTNTPALTAIANDYGYEYIFARQIEAHGRPGDMVIGLSTSGNSPNILKAIRKSKELGLVTVGMTGIDGGEMKREVTYWLSVPSDDTPRIQEGHILLGHVFCEVIESRFFGPV